MAGYIFGDLRPVYSAQSRAAGGRTAEDGTINWRLLKEPSHSSTLPAKRDARPG